MVVKEFIVKLSDFGSIEAPNTEYLEQQQRKFGWEGVVPSQLCDQALLSLAKDMRYPQIRLRGHCAPEENWVSKAASSATFSIVFATNKRGFCSKQSTTSKGMIMAIGHFQHLVEYEIISKITGRGFASNPDGDAAYMRELAQGE